MVSSLRPRPVRVAGGRAHSARRSGPAKDQDRETRQNLEWTEVGLSFSLQPKANADIPTPRSLRSLILNTQTARSGKKPERSFSMSKVSKESASRINDMGVAEDRTEEFDGYTVNFVS